MSVTLDVSYSDGLVEREGETKQKPHGRDAGRVPAADWLVEAEK